MESFLIEVMLAKSDHFQGVEFLFSSMKVSFYTSGMAVKFFGEDLATLWLERRTYNSNF